MQHDAESTSKYDSSPSFYVCFKYAVNETRRYAVDETGRQLPWLNRAQSCARVYVLGVDGLCVMVPTLNSRPRSLCASIECGLDGTYFESSASTNIPFTITGTNDTGGTCYWYSASASAESRRQWKNETAGSSNIEIWLLIANCGTTDKIMPK